MIEILIWERRQERGMTLRQLEERSVISRSTLQRLESGQQSPTLDQLDWIADALNVSISQLYTVCKK